MLSEGHNIVADGSCELAGPGDAIGVNPALGVLADNGGPTLTHLPLAGSPAIDSVPASVCTGLVSGPFSDQRGIARPQGAGCDAGAVEVEQILYNVCLLYDANKATKSGATYPVKFYLCNSSGDDVSAGDIVVHAVSITRVSTAISGEVQSSGNANPDNDFRFDSALGPSGGYIFNLKTTGLTTGSYTLDFVVTGDTFLYSAPFQVK
jgi:hypothetical protein